MTEGDWEKFFMECERLARLGMTADQISKRMIDKFEPEAGA